jgi:hypothetical protein
VAVPEVRLVFDVEWVEVGMAAGDDQPAVA